MYANFRRLCPSTCSKTHIHTLDERSSKYFEILSLTSPREAGKCQTSPKESTQWQKDFWEELLSPDYQEIIVRAVPPLDIGSKKPLYFRLPDSRIFLDGGYLRLLKYGMKNDRFNQRRKDGWMEIKLGEFIKYNEGDVSEVEMEGIELWLKSTDQYLPFVKHEYTHTQTEAEQYDQ
uniref:Uncharacterized protein n=1 Tax=Lactuca sativa TaxID=4236 RepID=A0A9R1WI09_LACSA|nr:hypothetical protein LSAT_V11C200065990 [Lactuca sativa]